MKPKKSSFQKIFPDTKVAAYYDPLSQIINLSKYDKDDFVNLDLSNPTADDIDKISLFEHEFTHWLDHVSTLWGQRNLVLIYNALNARANEDINEFWRVKHLTTSFSGDDFYDYFTVEYKRNIDIIRNPWRYQISSGIRFSENGKPEYNKPILFLRFNCFDDIPLLRVPISVASILETNAINAEFSLKFSLAHTIEDVVEKNLKLTEIKNELMTILYHKEFALYTVAAHLTANLNNQTDASYAYKIASSIGTTILNLPDDAYGKMELTNVGNKEWDRRIKEFQNIKDKGFGFYNLLKNNIDKKGQNQYSIEGLLESSGLIAKDELENLIIAEMEKNKESLIDGPFKNTAIKIIEKGIAIFQTRGIDGNSPDFRSKIFELNFLPKLIFGDTYFDDTNFDVLQVLEKIKQNGNLTLDEIYLTCDFYDKKFSEFVKACGI